MVVWGDVDYDGEVVAGKISVCQPTISNILKSDHHIFAVTRLCSFISLIHPLSLRRVLSENDSSLHTFVYLVEMGISLALM